MRRPALALAILCTLGACVAATDVPTQSATPPGALVTQTQAQITAQLRDPLSAQWRGIRGYTTAFGDQIICGEINAKNAFGGYVGFKQFYARYRGGQLMNTQLDGEAGLDLASVACGSAAAGTIKIPASQAG